MDEKEDFPKTKKIPDVNIIDTSDNENVDFDDSLKKLANGNENAKEKENSKNNTLNNEQNMSEIDELYNIELDLFKRNKENSYMKKKIQRINKDQISKIDDSAMNSSVIEETVDLISNKITELANTFFPDSLIMKTIWFIIGKFYWINVQVWIMLKSIFQNYFIVSFTIFTIYSIFIKFPINIIKSFLKYFKKNSYYPFRRNLNFRIKRLISLTYKIIFWSLNLILLSLLIVYVSYRTTVFLNNLILSFPENVELEVNFDFVSKSKNGNKEKPPNENEVFIEILSYSNMKRKEEFKTNYNIDNFIYRNKYIKYINERLNAMNNIFDNTGGKTYKNKDDFSCINKEDYKYLELCSTNISNQKNKIILDTDYNYKIEVISSFFTDTFKTTTIDDIKSHNETTSTNLNIKFNFYSFKYCSDYKNYNETSEIKCKKTNNDTNNNSNKIRIPLFNYSNEFNTNTTNKGLIYSRYFLTYPYLFIKNNLMSDFIKNIFDYSENFYFSYYLEYKQEHKYKYEDEHEVIDYETKEEYKFNDEHYMDCIPLNNIINKEYEINKTIFGKIQSNKIQNQINFNYFENKSFSNNFVLINKFRISKNTKDDYQNGRSINGMSIVLSRNILPEYFKIKFTPEISAIKRILTSFSLVINLIIFSTVSIFISIIIGYIKLIPIQM